MADIPNMPPDGWADNLAPTGFESPAQQLLRTEFAELAQQNQEQLQGFDPANLDTPMEEVQLYTVFPDVEQAEPTLAIHHSSAMLKRLGLDFRLLEHGDPDLIFQHAYSDDSLTQIRYLNREDGVRIPVMSEIDEEGLLAHLYLLNNEHTANTVAELQPEIDIENALAELATQLQISDDEELAEFYIHAEKLSLGEVQDALRDLRNPTPEKVSGDSKFSQQINGNNDAFGRVITETETAIREARKRYAKAAMPALRIFDKFLRRRAPARAQHYQQLVEDNLRQLDYADEHKAMELELEQGRRHEALNEQLHKRKLATKIGSVALGGALDGVFVAAGATAEHFHALGMSVDKGTLIGIAAAAITNLTQFIVTRRNLREAAPFDDITTAAPTQPLQQQLAAEIHRGEKNADIVHIGI